MSKSDDDAMAGCIASLIVLFVFVPGISALAGLVLWAAWGQFAEPEGWRPMSFPLAWGIAFVLLLLTRPFRGSK